MIPCHRLSATLSRTLPSSSRQHRGSLRRSDTSCVGGNLLLPTRLQPLSLLVAMGASLQLPPLPRCHSSHPTGSVIEPSTGRSPSVSRPPPNLAVCAGAKGPETGDLENEETARRRWRVTPPSPGGGPGGESCCCCCCFVLFCSARRWPGSQRYPKHQKRSGFSVSGSQEEDNTESLPSSRNQVRAVALESPLLVPTQPVGFSGQKGKE